MFRYLEREKLLNSSVVPIKINPSRINFAFVVIGALSSASQPAILHPLKFVKIAPYFLVRGLKMKGQSHDPQSLRVSNPELSPFRSSQLWTVTTGQLLYDLRLGSHPRRMKDVRDYLETIGYTVITKQISNKSFEYYLAPLTEKASWWQWLKGLFKQRQSALEKAFEYTSTTQELKPRLLVASLRRVATT